MNFDHAISSHQLWKTRLRLAIAGESSEALDPNLVCKDDHCEIGIWIHGEGGRTLDSKPEFVQFKKVHADFHQLAGAVLWKALEGDQVGAAALLNGPFTEASAEVIRAIVRCKAGCK